jgi:hypothetical protein
MYPCIDSIIPYIHAMYSTMWVRRSSHHLNILSNFNMASHLTSSIGIHCYNISVGTQWANPGLIIKPPKKPLKIPAISVSLVRRWSITQGTYGDYRNWVSVVMREYEAFILTVYLPFILLSGARNHNSTMIYDKFILLDHSSHVKNHLTYLTYEY